MNYRVCSWAALWIVCGVTAVSAQQPLSRIAFGSCSDQEKPLPIFDKIADLKPDFYISLGDTIYADIKPEKGLDEIESMKVKYQKLAALPGWQRLTKACPMMGTWDDHDYGKDDAGVEYARKDESQKVMLDFFGIPADSPLRKQKGVYQSRIVGPAGKRVQILLLDTRYFRSPLQKGKAPIGSRIAPYLPNTQAGATYLGEDQWKWLEEQLRQPAEVRLIGSSIQVVSEDHPFEKWTNIPAERERLYKLIKETKATGVVILSGDRHLAEISMQEDAVGYPLYDVTSSGLNQGRESWRAPEKNRHRVSSMAHGDNFGLITIDWSRADPRIMLQVRDEHGEIAVREEVPLGILKPRAAVATKADLPVKPSEGAISPRDALKKVGEKVTVEMKVQSVGGSAKQRIFLNSEKNFRDEQNFAIVVQSAALTGKFDGAGPDTFRDKVIRVTGEVTLFKDSPQIVVTMPAQLTIVEAKK